MPFEIPRFSLLGVLASWRFNPLLRGHRLPRLPQRVRFRHNPTRPFEKGSSCADVTHHRRPARPRAGERNRHRQGLGAHPPRFQGRVLVHRRARRLVLRPDPGRRARHLPNYASEILHITAGCSVIVHRHAGASPGQGAGVRDPGRRPSRSSAGSTTPRPIPISAEAAHVRVPARGRAPAAAHQHVRRASRACATPEPGRSTASSTSAGSSGSTRRSSPPATAEGAGRDVPGVARWTSRTCRARRRARSTSRRTSSASRRRLTV